MVVCAPSFICPRRRHLRISVPHRRHWWWYSRGRRRCLEDGRCVFARSCCKLSYLGSDRSPRGEGNDSLVFGDVIPSLARYRALGARSRSRPVHRPITLGVVAEHSEWVEVGRKCSKAVHPLLWNSVVVPSNKNENQLICTPFD